MGYCLLNYACMTESFDGIVGACTNRVVNACVHIDDENEQNEKLQSDR